MKPVSYLVTGVVCLLIAAAALAASVPGLVNYQGRLMDTAGGPIDAAGVPVDFSLWDSEITILNIKDESVLMGGTASAALAHGDITSGSEKVTGQGGAPLYESPRDYTIDYISGAITRVDAASGGYIPDGATVEIDYEWTRYGAMLWQESQLVDVHGGLYQTAIGLVNPLSPSVFSGGTLYLEVVVDGETLVPRRRLSSSPYAFFAETAAIADTLDGFDYKYFAAASHSHDFSELDGTADDNQIPDTITIKYASNAGRLGGFYPDSYVSASGDTVMGDFSIMGRMELGSDLYVSGDAAIMGGNIGLGTLPSSSYSILNGRTTAPSTGALLYGTNYGLYARLAGDVNDHYAYLASYNTGVYGQSGAWDETGIQYGGRFQARSEGSAYGVSALAYGYSTSSTHGVYAYGSNNSSGPVSGLYAYSSKSSGSGDSRGVYGYAYNNTAGDAHGGHFEAYNGTGDAYSGYFKTTASGAGTHYGVYASADDYAGWFQDGRVHIGDGGTEEQVDGDGDLYVEDTLEVDGFLHVGSGGTHDNIDGDDDLYVKDTLEVDGMSYFTDDINVGKDANISGSAIVDGYASIYGDLSVYGGNIGIGRSSYYDAGIANSSSAPPLYGARLYGDNTAVFGMLASDPDYHYGYLGNWRTGVGGKSGSFRDTGDMYGGYFEGSSQGRAYGVHARATGWGLSDAYGVYSYTRNENGGDAYGVYAYAYSPNGGNYYGLYNAAGTKSWVNPDPEDPEKSVVYATLEGGENGTYWRGTAQLTDGYAEVILPDHFRKVTSADYPVTATVTPRAECNGLMLVKTANDKIIVKEMMGGKSEAEFDFIVMGKRLGYEDFDPVIDNVDYVPFQGNQAGLDPSESTTQEWYDSQPPGLKKILKQNGTLTAEGKVNERAFEARGWKLVKERAPKEEHPIPERPSPQEPGPPARLERPHR